MGPGGKTLLLSRSESTRRRDGKVVAPGCASKPSQGAGEEPEDHGRLSQSGLDDKWWSDSMECPIAFCELSKTLGRRENSV